MEDDSIATFVLDDDRKESGEPSGPPTDSSPDSLPMPRCSMCGKEELRIHSHHAVPRYIGGGREDLIEVCAGCHVRSDTRVKTLLLDPFGLEIGKFWVNAEKRARQHKERYRRRNIFYMIIEGEDVSITIALQYNRLTKRISFHNIHIWRERYPHNRYKRYARMDFLAENIIIEPNVRLHLHVVHYKRYKKIKIKTYLMHGRRYHKCILGG